MKDFFISITNYFKALFAIIAGVLFPLSLILFAYPKLLGEIMFFGFFILSIVICILIRKRKIKLDILELLSVFALIVYTQIIHITLLAHESNIHLLIVKSAEFKLGTNNEITSAFSNLIIVSYLVISILGITCRHISEAHKEFSQDTLNTMFIDIGNKSKKGQLTQEQAVHEREKIKSNADYYSDRDGVFKTVFKCMVAYIILTAIHFFAGIGSDMYIRKLILSEAFDENIPLTIGAAYPFIVLFILFAITCFWRKSEQT